MVSTIPNPAIEALVARVAPEFAFAQVLLRKIAEGFDLRHVEDREASSLRLVSLGELREIAQFTARKQFRPLKSAPTLHRGWHFIAGDVLQLNAALSRLYPGAVADWFAARRPNPPITHYREFTARQTGMYRITTMLTDMQAAQVARACCHPRFCLKQRFWTVESLRPDTTAEKSELACLEPCSLLMEFARVAVRIDQREKFDAPAVEELNIPMSEIQALAEASNTDVREADFSSPKNPRHAQLMLEKLSSVITREIEA